MKDSEEKKGPDGAGSSSPKDNIPSSSGREEKHTTQESPIKKLAGDGSHMKRQARNSKEAGTDLAASRRIGNFNDPAKTSSKPFSSDPAETSSKPTWKIVLSEKDGLDGGGMVEIGTWNGMQINMVELPNSRTDNQLGLLLPDNLAAWLYLYATPPEIREMATDAGLEVVAMDENGCEYLMSCTYTNSGSGGDQVEGLVLKADWAEFARAHGGSSVEFVPNAKSTVGSLLINAFRYQDGRLCLVFLFKKPQGGADDQ